MKPHYVTTSSGHLDGDALIGSHVEPRPELQIFNSGFTACRKHDSRSIARCDFVSSQIFHRQCTPPLSHLLLTLSFSTVKHRHYSSKHINLVNIPRLLASSLFYDPHSRSCATQRYIYAYKIPSYDVESSIMPL